MKKTQIGWLIIAIIGILNVLVLSQIHDVGSVKILVIISLVVLLLFFQLTIRVDKEYVRFSFGIGLIRGKYRLVDIESCRPISYFPLGWGIRFRPGIVLFNVSGTKAIELSIKGKSRKIWIGTNNPDEVASAVNELLKLNDQPKDYTSVRQVNSSVKNQYLLIVGVIAIIILFTFYENQDTKITLQKDNIKISGLYGGKITYENISQVDTISRIPSIKMRTNGYSFGKVCKGNFRLSEVGNAKLFINFSQTTFIQLKLKNNTLYYFNFKDRKKTIDLFEGIKEKITPNLIDK
jgi:hypothetical protein